jgi:hypothetical protein
MPEALAAADDGEQGLDTLGSMERLVDSNLGLCILKHRGRRVVTLAGVWDAHVVHDSDGGRKRGQQQNCQRCTQEGGVELPNAGGGARVEAGRQLDRVSSRGTSNLSQEGGGKTTSK